MFEGLNRTGYIIIMVLIMGAVFLSQQPYAIEYGQKLYLGALAQEQVYQAKISDWVMSKLGKKQAGLPAQAGDSAGGEGAVESSADVKNNQNKNNIFQNNFLK